MENNCTTEEADRLYLDTGRRAVRRRPDSSGLRASDADLGIVPARDLFRCLLHLVHMPCVPLPVARGKLLFAPCVSRLRLDEHSPPPNLTPNKNLHLSTAASLCKTIIFFFCGIVFSVRPSSYSSFYNIFRPSFYNIFHECLFAIKYNDQESVLTEHF